MLLNNLHENLQYQFTLHLIYTDERLNCVQSIFFHFIYTAFNS